MFVRYNFPKRTDWVRDAILLNRALTPTAVDFSSSRQFCPPRSSCSSFPLGKRALTPNFMAALSLSLFKSYRHRRTDASA